jgi:hypothetical protein
MGDTKPPIDSGEVMPDRRLADRQNVGDLLVSIAFAN